MIYDLDNNSLPSYLMNLSSSGLSQFSIRVNCRIGLHLRSESVSDLLVEGRHLGSSSWINLQTTGIDLTTWAGARETFEIRITASAVTSRVSHTFRGLYTE